MTINWIHCATREERAKAQGLRVVQISMTRSNHAGRWTLYWIATSGWLPTPINLSKLLGPQTVNRMKFRTNTPHLDMSNLHNLIYSIRSAGTLLRTIWASTLTPSSFKCHSKSSGMHSTMTKLLSPTASSSKNKVVSCWMRASGRIQQH